VLKLARNRNWSFLQSVLNGTSRFLVMAQ